MTLTARLRGPIAAVVAVVVALALPACADPVHDDAVAALGGDPTNAPPGPLHRPGQPCLVCHDGGGPGALVFGTAGTIYQDATDPTPLVGATVVLTDATMNVMRAQTNCAGNFFIEAVDWTLTGPVHIEVDYGGMNAQMVSHMAKQTSCAQCHTGTLGPASVQQVYLNPTAMTYPPSGCP